MLKIMLHVFFLSDSIACVTTGSTVSSHTLSFSKCWTRCNKVSAQTEGRRIRKHRYPSKTSITYKYSRKNPWVGICFPKYHQLLPVIQLRGASMTCSSHPFSGIWGNCTSLHLRLGDEERPGEEAHLFPNPDPGVATEKGRRSERQQRQSVLSTSCNAGERWHYGSTPATQMFPAAKCCMPLPTQSQLLASANIRFTG